MNIDLELLREILSDDKLHIMIGLVKRVAVSSDRSVCQVMVSILPEQREIVAKMTWEAIGNDCGFFMLPIADELVLVGQAEGDKDQAFILKRLTTKDELIPTTATDGSIVMKARTGKKVWITSDTRINLSTGDSAPTENLVLGQQIKTLLASLIADIAAHTHVVVDPISGPVTSAVPGNAAALTALKTGSVDNSAILSQKVFTE